jgi:Protein of unknown function (DUF732)
MLTSVAAMIGMAAPASADPPSDADADFISQLKDAGLTHQDPASAIAAAKDVCSLVDNGTPAPEIEKNLVSRNPALSERGAVVFITLAAAEYCPKYLTGESRAPKPPGAQGN